MFVSMIVIVALTISFKVTCKVCCDDYECSSVSTKEDCERLGLNNGWQRCSWSAGTCSEVICTNFSSSREKCEEHWRSNCAYFGSVCRRIMNCGDVPEERCLGWWSFEYGSKSQYCQWMRGVCKTPTCADYEEEYECEYAKAEVLGACKFAKGVCSPTTSCGDWTDRPDDCGKHEFFVNDQGYMPCAFVDGECRLQTCTDFNSHSKNCLDKHCKYHNGACTASISCNDWDGMGAENCVKLSLFDNCIWNDDTSTCVSRLGCGLYDTEDECDLASCYYLDSCPTSSYSSANFVSPLGFLIMSIFTFLL